MDNYNQNSEYGERAWTNNLGNIFLSFLFSSSLYPTFLIVIPESSFLRSPDNNIYHAIEWRFLRFPDIIYYLPLVSARLSFSTKYFSITFSIYIYWFAIYAGKNCQPTQYCHISLSCIPWCFTNEFHEQCTTGNERLSSPSASCICINFYTFNNR